MERQTNLSIFYIHVIDTFLYYHLFDLQCLHGIYIHKVCFCCCLKLCHSLGLFWILFVYKERTGVYILI